MRILLLNQYGSGDRSPTARLLSDLAEELGAKGCNVVIASAAGSYENKKTGWRRRVHEIILHMELFLRGIKSPKPDLIVSFTSPACLIVTGAILAWTRGARHIHWAMDLYPDLALALGEIKRGVVYTVLQKAMKWAYSRCDQVVVLEEDMQEYMRSQYGIEAKIISPWPGPLPVRSASSTNRRGEADWVWMYSGNMGRAHEFETLLDVQDLLEKENVPASLVFQGAGNAVTEILHGIKKRGLKRCFVRSYAPEEKLLESLLEARVLVATCKPCVRGMLWPSKLALLEMLPKPLLWVGAVEGSLAGKLREREATGVFSPGSSVKVKKWLLKLKPDLELGQRLMPDLEKMRRQGLEKWMALLKMQAKN